MAVTFATMLPRLRAIQNGLMSESCRIVRNGVTVASGVSCRKTSSRLFAESPDPQDANMRSMQEWGWTMPYGTDVRVGDAVELTDGSLSTIAGEVLKDDTWKTAVRVWATRPKTATPSETVNIYRYQDALDDWTLLGAFTVQVVYDRNETSETPIRYARAARTSYKGGWFIGDSTFTVRAEDRFTMDGYAGVIESVLPNQPQRVEARFSIDIGGVQ